MADRMPALMAAKAVALSARTGSLTMHAVDDARTKAEELLGRSDDLRSAIIRFATKFEEFRRDAYALSKLGEELDRAIEEALGLTRPAPAHRADLDD